MVPFKHERFNIYCEQQKLLPNYWFVGWQKAHHEISILIVFSLFLALTIISSPGSYFARTMNSLGHRFCTAGVVWRLDAALSAVIWSCGGTHRGWRGGPTVYEGGHMGGTCVVAARRWWGGSASQGHWATIPPSTNSHSPLLHQYSIFQTLSKFPKWQAPQISYSLILQVKKGKISFTAMKSIRRL